MKEQENDRAKLRALLIKARFYHLCALVFAMIGIVLFGYLFFLNTKGNIVTALADPATVVILLVPFLPAAVLSWMGAAAEKKVIAMLEAQKNPS